LIYIEVPSIPISANAAYAKKRGSGARILTEKGRRYKKETTNHIVRAYPQELKFFQKNVPYQLLVHFTFGSEVELLNKGYPATADSRYKKNDVTNRMKLFEDALCDATGTDDSQHFIVTLVKATGEKDCTRLWVWNLEEESYNAISNVIDTLLCISGVESDGAVPAVS
jgi:Holliday junction resolvase RusA-like endonuclease